MKRLLIITSTFPRWKNDKTPPFVFELGKNLSSQKNLKVMVLAPHCRGAKFKEIMDDVLIHRFPYFYPLFLQQVSYEGGILPNLKRNNLAKLQVVPFLISEFMVTLFLVIKNKIEIINSHWIIPQGFIGALVKKLTRVKKHIVTIHAGDISLLERLPFKKEIFAFIIKNSDFLVFVSQYGKNRLKKIVRSDLAEEFERKTKIIPMGIYIKNFQRNNNHHCVKTLLFVGRLVEKKGVKYLLRSIPLVRNKIPNIKLTIVGDGPSRESLENLAKKSAITDHVDFVGFKTGQEKINYFHSSGILVVPSIQTERGDVEGLPVVIMEGMAAGKPIIASNVGGISEIVRENENGFLVKPESPDHLAEKIVHLLNSPGTAEQMGKASFLLAKSYGWDEIGAKYLQVIKF